MEESFKYLIYYRGKPIHFNITSKKVITYKDVFSFKDKENNTREIKDYIKEWAYNRTLTKENKC